MKVAGYIRCSTTKQDLESQEHSLIEWAEKNEHTITIFKDYAISGKIEARKGIDELMQRCRAHEFEAVAVLEISRFGRSIKIIYQIVEELSKLGIKIILSNSNTTLDYNSLEGRALIGGLSLAADIEWLLLNERNKRGREKIKREHIKVGRKPSEQKSINLDAVLTLRAQGKGIRETARLLCTSAPTILRILERYEDGHKRNVTKTIDNDTLNPQKSEGVT